MTTGFDPVFERLPGVCRSAAAATQHPVFQLCAIPPYPLAWRGHDQQHGRQHERHGARGYPHWTSKPKYLSSIVGPYPPPTPITELRGGSLTG
jgi:hypothetical protein